MLTGFYYFYFSAVATDTSIVDASNLYSFPENTAFAFAHFLIPLYRIPNTETAPKFTWRVCSIMITRYSLKYTPPLQANPAQDGDNYACCRMRIFSRASAS